MPKLQYFTAHLLDEDKNVFPERMPKTLYSSKYIAVRCEMPRNGGFTVRLSSAPIPFDMVVKVFLDGCFLAGRCFLAGDSDPIIFDYEIGPDQNNYNHCRGSSDFQFKWSFSRVQVSVHKCRVGNKTPSESFDSFHHPKSPSSFCPGLPIIADWTDIPPVILHEEPEPCLSIVWECTRSELQRN
ncbi:hypothetical protein MJO28_001365 [Puccinia striiformis f. sp. tritici]|uniref:Uncharacterized protein n=1 Tax=Puccinia striiformis f. sp. tritici TaxID=168172 RepID=A0ACC0EUV4_9BASI|nr:hypothetical protein MJO28_001365 [Puccinia striiformis f. sp. tritici]